MQNITLDGNNISADGGIQLTQIQNGETDLTMGMAVSSELVVNLINSSVFTGFDWTEEFRLDFGVDIAGVTNWVTVGYFKGKKPERTIRTETIEFTAYDRMQLFDVLADDYVDGITYPITLANIYHGLCTYLGLSYSAGDEIADSMALSFSESPFNGGMTCRQLLAYIAEANGCYAKIDASGNVKLAWFTDQTSAYSVDGNKYFNISIDEATAPVIQAIRVACTYDDGFTGFVYPVGTYTTYYQIVDNPILIATGSADLTTVITDILARFTAFGAYTPINVDIMGNWMVETGDIIEVEDLDGNTFDLPIFARTLQWNGGCEDVYECTGNTIRAELSQSIAESYETGGLIANKYTVKSGVDITDDGITVSGGRWIKLISGGVLDVQATNFSISSTNKSMICGIWSIDSYGMRAVSNNHGAKAFQIQLINGVYNPDETPPDLSTVIDCFSGIKTTYSNGFTGFYTTTSLLASDNATTGHIAAWSVYLVKNVNAYYAFYSSKYSDGISASYLGDANNHFDGIYVDSFNGDCVKNNLTTTSGGYALDARQGKALNDELGTTTSVSSYITWQTSTAPKATNTSSAMYKCGKVRDATFGFTPSASATGWKTFGTLASAHRPAHNIYGATVAGTSTLKQFRIRSSGEVQIYSPDTQEYLFSATYLVS